MAKAADNAERSAFLRDLKKRTNELAAAAKKEASNSFLTDEELINALDLSETKKQFVTKVSRVRYGLDKHKTPYFSFNYVITDTEGEGTSVSTFFGLGGKTKEEREKKDARLCANFQRLGVDTTKFPPATVTDKLVEAADKLTLDKPTVVLSLYTWGDDPKKPRLGVDVVSVRANKGPVKGKAKPADDDAEEEQYEDAEDAEEAEEESEEEIDYASYVGYEAEFDTGEAVITVAATEYDEDTGLFTVEDENGDQYEASFEDLNFGE